ncbi:UNKNOWN [Stylonychia lemnae]|uniref:Uncharacterized protein n=1 Tax=Stylonychia lemnae TaxID=5949 RepID=A0A078AF09_STYLE|nr:UNKNOWN [Stylonychia lemnae]|eukprot:CDW80854.1 UNKNOWN [Stylonychia lemnae]
MKTLPGACATLVYVIILILYLAFQLRSIGEVSQVVYQQSFTALEDQKLELTADNFHFELSVGAQDQLKDLMDVQGYLSVYGRVSNYNNQGILNSTLDIMFRPCSHNDQYYDRFVSFCLLNGTTITLDNRKSKLNIYLTKCDKRLNIYGTVQCYQSNNTQLFKYINERSVQV